jgi:biopolymer transport protein ExbB/TolQ
MNTPAWMHLTEWGARLTLLALVVLSILSIAIILDRRKLLRSRVEPAALADLKAAIRNGKPAATSSRDSVVSRYLTLLGSSLGQAPTEAVDRATRSFLAEERQQLERGLTFLATIGSNAPFIGLFGTVLGIIQAFGELSSQQSGSASVMSAISEALVATAVGLLVAIPAVVAFNLFQRRIREILVPCEILRDEFLAHRGRKD